VHPHSDENEGLVNKEALSNRGCIPALADDDRVTKIELERRGHVGRNVLVALLITVVLLDVMKVVTADDDSPVPQKRKESTFDARDVSPVLCRRKWSTFDAQDVHLSSFSEPVLTRRTVSSCDEITYAYVGSTGTYLFILVDTTVPRSSFPRIDTVPAQGHFLSM
jgi:hypothetical protein